MRIIIHAMPEDSMERRAAPPRFRFPACLCPRPVACNLPARVVEKIGIRRQIPDPLNTIPWAGETSFYPPGSPERYVHRAMRLTPEEKKRARDKHRAAARNAGMDW